MKEKHWHEAYKKFMVIVIKKVQSLSPDQLKKPDSTAKMLIDHHFKKIIAEIAKKSAKKKLKQRYPPLKKKHDHHK